MATPLVRVGDVTGFYTLRQWNVAGPGGESLLHLPDKDLMVFHAYSATDGRPQLQISTVGWKDGWPHAALEGDQP